MLLTKYSLWASLKSLKIFYLVYIPIVFVTHIIALLNLDNNNSKFTFTGFDTATAVFMFILGLAIFVEVFQMAMANSQTRKDTFIAAISTAIPLAFIIAIVDRIIMILASFMAKSSTIFFMIYAEKYSSDSLTLSNILTSILWEALVMITIFMFGYMLSSIYYRLDKFAKLLFSLIIFVVPIVGIPLVDNILTDGQLIKTFVNFILKAFGISTCNPFIAVLTLTVISIVFSAIGFIITSRTKIKKA